MLRIEITQGESAGQVVETDDLKAARMIAAGVAVKTDKPLPEPPTKPKPKTVAPDKGSDAKK